MSYRVIADDLESEEKKNYFSEPFLLETYTTNVKEKFGIVIRTYNLRPFFQKKTYKILKKENKDIIINKTKQSHPANEVKKNMSRSLTKRLKIKNTRVTKCAFPSCNFTTRRKDKHQHRVTKTKLLLDHVSSHIECIQENILLLETKKLAKKIEKKLQADSKIL